jgi:hypothetical protein
MNGQTNWRDGQETVNASIVELTRKMVQQGADEAREMKSLHTETAAAKMIKHLRMKPGTSQNPLGILVWLYSCHKKGILTAALKDARKTNSTIGNTCQIQSTRTAACLVTTTS